jgi:hypothetical protein
MVGFAGLTLMDTSVAAVACSLADPETRPRVAVTAIAPGLIAVAWPWEFAALLMDATFGSDELQVTEDVRSCVELSVYTPVAFRVSVDPSAIVGLEGVTLMDTRAAAVTVRLVVPDTAPSVAVTVVAPGLIAVASPRVSVALLRVATPSLAELQVTREVMFCFEPSL